MSDLKQTLQDDLNLARKAGDRLRTSVLSMTISEIRNREIEKGGVTGDADVREVLGRAVKQRREAAEQMRSGGREELARKEEQEAEILREYLPEPLDEEKVRVIVRELISEGASDLGAVMGRLMPRIRERFEGREANRIVREELEGR